MAVGPALRGTSASIYRPLVSDPAAPPRGLPGDCFVETAEGPVPMAETPNKGFAVLTRLPSGLLGFRQLIKVVTSER
ncbi:MAG: hypothetical protein E6J71_18595, partial [Deltaproteobacteria bacterium]